MVESEKTMYFTTDLISGLIKVNILNQGFIHLGAGGFWKWDQRAIRQMMAPPEIYASSISMISYAHVVFDLDVGEIMVVVCSMKETRTHSK